jgi:hypothetical protein
MKKLVVLSTALLGLLTSCKKETINPDNGGKEATMSFAIRAANTSNQKNTPGTVLRWSSGTVNASHVRFQGKMSHITYITQAFFNTPMDLFAAMPLSTSFTLPTGTYTRAEMDITLVNGTTAPSMQLQGGYTQNGSTIPVTFTIGQNAMLHSNLDNVTISNTSAQAFTTLDLDGYTSGITAAMLQSAQANASGTIEISGNSNKNLYDIIINNMSSKNAPLTMQ